MRRPFMVVRQILKDVAHHFRVVMPVVFLEDMVHILETLAEPILVLEELCQVAVHMNDRLNPTSFRAVPGAGILRVVEQGIKPEGGMIGLLVGKVRLPVGPPLGLLLFGRHLELLLHVLPSRIVRFGHRCCRKLNCRLFFIGFQNGF
ncbi:MAG: hypothetical protein M2R45_01717 [Verrucomicrobia subdivision 3 bacterium]|nr:hypothetical protein [Limisphaerales bacterium]